MIMKGIVERIIYPDEPKGISFDGLYYDDIVVDLEACIADDSRGGRDYEDTLAEIRRRWAARQAAPDGAKERTA